MIEKNSQQKIQTLFQKKDYAKIIKFASKKIKSEPKNDYYFAIRGKAFENKSNLSLQLKTLTQHFI